MSRINSLVPELQDRAIFFGWVAGLAIAGALLWTLTQPLREDYLLRSVNRLFTAANDNRRLAAPLGRAQAKSGPTGVWYSLRNSTSTMYVFTVMRDGILVPCGAQVSPEGTVEAIIPLGVNAVQVFDRISPALMRIYIQRIEFLAQGGGS